MISSDEFPRVRELAEAGYRILDFSQNSTFARRMHDPDILDFTLGNPNEMPIDGYAEVMKTWAVPQHERWYAYSTSLPAAQAAAANSLASYTGVPFESHHLVMTNGGFGAISTAFKAVTSPGDEVIFCRPPWFAYEIMIREASLTPVKVSLEPVTFDLDIEAIRAAITAKTRLIVINTPHNPTGKIYQAATLERLAALLHEESQRIGRTIYLLSDEVYNRIVFDGREFHTPAAWYPHTLVAYSYGKTQLTPGQRIGYLALAPSMPNHAEIRRNIQTVLLATGYAFPSTLLQHAVPDLEKLCIDLEEVQKRRDRFVTALREMGYELHTPEATLWLLPRSPWRDDVAFTEKLAEHDIFVVPGTVCEIPGFIRISLTGTDEMIDRALPGFRAALEFAQSHSSPSLTAPAV
jgi:aspartate aminotransferase